MKPNLTNISMVLRGTSTRNRANGQGNALWPGLMSGSGKRRSLPRRNVRVAGAPFRTSSMVKLPSAMASSAQLRTAAWKARRQDSRQNRCARPPLCRGRNGRSHQGQEGATLTEALATKPWKARRRGSAARDGTRDSALYAARATKRQNLGTGNFFLSETHNVGERVPLRASVHLRPIP